MLRKIKQTVHHKRLIKSFLCALEGLLNIFINHHNAQLIVFFSIIAILCGVAFKISTFEMTVVLLTIGLVFVSEIFNTMVEDITNLITDKKFHPAVKVIKDMSAAAVLFACIISVIIGYFIFIKRIIILWNQKA